MILVPRERIEDYVARGWWGEETLAGLFIATARRQPQAAAVSDPPNRMQVCAEPPRRWTWGDLLRETGRMAALLHAQGLRKDDVVVVQLPNCVELHALYLACACSGVVISPLPVQYRGHELAHVIATTGAKAAITTTQVGKYQAAAEWHDHFGDRLPVWSFGTPPGPGCAQPAPHGGQGNLGRPGVSLGAPRGVLALGPALAAIEPWDASRLEAHMAEIGLTAHDVVTICWTSGTEARPKGVPRNHNEWLIVGRSVVDAGQLQPGARMVIPFPFVNMAGVSTSLVAWLLVGGELHHHHPFDLDVFVSQLRDHPTDYTVAAPAVLSMLLKEPGRLDGVQVGRLKRIGSGGGPLADWLVEGFADRFGIEIVNYFGSNEGAALSSTPQDIPDRRQRTLYFPRLGARGSDSSLPNARKVRTRLVDLDTGTDIEETGRIGELRFQGPAIFSGYFNAPELTARAFDEQGFYRTGDLFEIAGDRKQFYRFAGRHKDIVIRGGMNISSEEVEGLLLAHPKVREAAVIGYPDPVMGERVCAVVVPQPGEALALDDLVAFLRNEEQVASFKWPEKLVLTDRLPRNPIGKVLKRELRELYCGEAAR